MSRPLPRFTDQAIQHDPLEIILAQAEARRQTAIDQLNAGKNLADATDKDRIRGIPMQAKGIGGTSPGTDPLANLLRNIRTPR